MMQLSSILRIAWRNLWRSRRRTLINMGAIALGLMMVIVYGSIMEAVMGEAKNELDSTGLGHVELTAPTWRSQHEPRAALFDVDSLRARLVLPPEAEVSVRVVARGLLGSAHGNEAIELHGVDWQDEARVAAYVNDVRSGALPVADDVRGVVIGEGLAARLKVKVGAKVRLLVQRVDGEMGAELFRVRGIFHAASPSVDKRRVLVARSTAAEVLGLPGAAHQIVIQLGRAADAAPVAATIRTALAGGAGAAGAAPVVETYAEIFPIFQTMESLMDSVMVVAAFFVYLLVGLGIMNTMLMGVLERTREFGVMQALGTRPSGIVALVLAESFWTATLAVIVGLALGLTMTWAGSVTPLLDFSDAMGESVELGGLAVGTAFRTTFSVVAGLKASLWVYGMALVVGLYPAWHVARLRPVEALRRN